MTKTAHVLELNGKKYDAVTGRMLANAARSVDGFAPYTVAPSAPTKQTPRSPSTPVATLSRPKVMDLQRPTPHHAKARQPQHSHTLMRHAVHPPQHSLKRTTKVAVNTGALVKQPTVDIVPKQLVSTVDARRLKHAQRVSQSNLIHRFATYSPRSVMPAPATKPAPAAPMPPTPKVQPVGHQASTDLFERALATANSHQQRYVAPKRVRKGRVARRIAGVAASALAVLLIAGFVAYQNTALIQLRLASAQAGINATLPAWQPSGFKLGALTTGPSTVNVSYHTADGQSFTISQTASSWDSSALLSDYVYPNNDTYNTISAGNSTIYTYGNNNATWVNHGIWYKLTTHGTLSTSQIVNIATSM